MRCSEDGDIVSDILEEGSLSFYLGREASNLRFEVVVAGVDGCLCMNEHNWYTMAI